MSQRTAHRLSKSKFLSGLQCHKRLYLEVHSPELATEPSEATRSILDMGTEVGELARRCFPNGVLVEASHRHAEEALKRTAELLNDPDVPAIFEGAFRFDDVLVRVDILERVEAENVGTASWRLIEVKSSTRVKDIHLPDLAIQHYVLTGTGIRLVADCLMHINIQYVYDGHEPNLDQLFTLQDLSAHVADRQLNVPGQLLTMKEMLNQPAAPSVKPDGHCRAPYECQFWDHCVKDKPARWVYYLPGEERTFQALTQKGIETIDQIPDSFTLSTVQRRMKDNLEWTGPQLQSLLKSVRYPIHHLDFETIMPAIPKYAVTRPYQTIPVQWSNHIETEDGQVRHEEYLHQECSDPRRDLTLALLDSVGERGSICVYSSYERAILERLAEGLPTLRSDLLQVIERLWDLFPIIKDHYYHPAFAGSFSIKSVLPAIVPSLGYGDLRIKEGGVAASQYYRMVFLETDWVERMNIRESLLQYCGRDTLAMVELRKALWRKCSAPNPM
ncbi:MAG: DUF2779 domain-containing protein [Nitrospiraceae bacterium]